MPCKASTNCSLMSPNACIDVRKTTKCKESTTAAKKRHTMKNTVMSTLTKHILFIGRTFTGHNHDYSMLKQELPPDQPWFDDIHVLVDLGYLGMSDDYDNDNIYLPCKKPRKSKKNPKPEFGEDQKAVNHALSKLRIFVENAIGGMKRYNILVQRFRNHKHRFDDDVICICAGLWNFSLSFNY